MNRTVVNIAATLILVGAACGEDHAAYDLEIDATELEASQQAGEPEDRARLVITVEIVPTPDHTDSVVRLGATSRFDSGVLRFYEPEPNSRFVYDGRKPVLAVPAMLVSAGRRFDEGVMVADEPVTIELHGQVSNLELEPLCGDRIVAVPRLVISDPAASQDQQTRQLWVTAVGEVSCR